MSKYDRCTICDYSEANGSSYANKPRSDKKVRKHGDDFYCDDCATSIVDTYKQYIIPEGAELPVEDLPETLDKMVEELS